MAQQNDLKHGKSLDQDKTTNIVVIHWFATFKAVKIVF